MSIGQGLLVAGQAIGQGIREHRQLQDEKRQEKAAVEFIMANSQKLGMGQLDEQEAKAGIKAAGGAAKLMEVFQQAQAEKRAAEQDARAQQYFELANKQYENARGDAAAERGATRIAMGAAPTTEELGAQLQRGGTFQSTMPQQGGDAMANYLAAGGSDPRMANVLLDRQQNMGAPQGPSVFTTPSGQQFLTNGRTILPAGMDPESPNKEPPLKTKEVDGQTYYLSGNTWRPVAKGSAGKSALTPRQIAEYRQVLRGLNDSLIKDNELKRNGNTRYGGLGGIWNSRQARIDETKRQIQYYEDLLTYGGQALEGGPPGMPENMDAEDAPPPPAGGMTADQFYSGTN